MSACGKTPTVQDKTIALKIIPKRTRAKVSVTELLSHGRELDSTTHFQTFLRKDIPNTLGPCSVVRLPKRRNMPLCPSILHT